ncbi:hypothetical protein HA402_013820 [Bradysia odoriphaga]|nr:hypothetical protein HA402_013820 [Bradysia odoriphaga]
MTISSWNFVQNKNLKLMNLTNFMLKKCEEKLRKICIIGDMELDLFGQQIGSILLNVQTVEFRNRRGAVDEAQFLARLPNLKKLILGSEINSENVDEILQQRYHRLTQFYYLYDNGINLNAEKLKVFFRNNDKINSIEWKFRMIDDLSRQHFVKCLQTVGYAEHLTHFRLCFSNQLSKYKQKEFADICNQLNLLCKRDTFKFLEMTFIESACYDNDDDDDDDTSTALSRMKCFAEWKQLSKIHLQRFEIITTMPVISEFVHLKSIVFNSCYLINGNEVIDDRATMSQISEVVMKNVHFYDVTKLCKPFVRHWKNLRTIFVPVANYGSKLDIAKLNRAREKLNDACELTIFTNHKSLPTNLEHAMVKLQCDLNR